MKLKQKALARLMVLPMVLSAIPVSAHTTDFQKNISLSNPIKTQSTTEPAVDTTPEASLTLEEQESEWRLGDASQFVTGIEGANGKVLQVGADTSGESNAITLENPTRGITTIQYRVKTEPGTIGTDPQFKGGLKVYTDSYASENEVARLRIEEQSLKHTNGDTIFEAGKIKSAKYDTLATNMVADTWHSVKVVYTPVGDKMVADVYIDGTKVNDEPLTTPDDAANPGRFQNVGALCFASDTKTEGTYYIDDLTVEVEEIDTEGPDEVLPGPEPDLTEPGLEETATWKYGTACGLEEGVTGANGKVLKVVSGTAGTSNSMALEDPQSGVTTIEYRLMTEPGETFKGGLKLYADDTSSANEVARLRIEGQAMKHAKEGTTFKEAGGINKAAYDTVSEDITPGVWHQVKLVYTPDGDKMLGDVYLNGTKVNDAPLTTPFDEQNPTRFSNIGGINFASDSKTQGTYYIDDLSVKVEQPVVTGGTLEEAAWEAGASGQLVQRPEYAETPIYQIEAGAAGGSNKQQLDVTGEVVTIHYKLLTEGNADLKGGYKLYDAANKEIARLKVDNGKIAHYNAAGAYDKFTVLEDLAWHDIAIIYTKEADAMLTDIYINGTKVNSVPLSNPGDGSSFGSINFFTDSNRTGSYFIDQLTVEAGRHEPAGPMEPDYVGPQQPPVNPDVETPKPEIPYEVGDTPKAAYPKENVYGSGLNGHVITSPDKVKTIIDVTAHGVKAEEGFDNTQAVRDLISKAAYGTELYFPNGTYEFITNDSTILALKDGVSLRGESEKGTQLKAVIKDTDVTTTFMAGVGVTNLSIRDLTLTSKFYGQYPDPVSKGALDTNPPQQGNMVYGINLNYNIGTGQPCEAIEINGVTIENFSRMAIGLRHTQDVRVKGCTFQYATDIGGGGAGYGVSIQGAINQDDLGKSYDSRHNIVEECKFVGPYIRHGVLLQYYTHNNLVINNSFYGTGYGSIDLHGEDEYLNEIAYNEVFDTRWGGGIELGNSGAGHDLAGPLNYVHHNLIEGGLRGIDVVFGTPDTIIENNTISGTRASGIMLQNAERTIVRDNTITGVQSDETDGKGIYLDYHKGYSYNGNSTWGAGKPVQSDIYDNQLSGNEVDYAIVDGQDNTLHGSVAVDGEKVVEKSTNAHLVGIEVMDAELTRPFLPVEDTYYSYTNKATIEMLLHTSAKNVSSMTVEGQAVRSGQPVEITLVEGVNEVAINVIAEDGVTSKDYTLYITRLGEGETVPTPVQTVELKGADPSIPLGKTYVLEAVVGPENASNKAVKWEILSGEAYVSISDTGKVTPLAVGEAKVKVSSVQNPEVSDTFTITILDKIPGQPELDPNAVKLTVESIEATHEDTGKSAANAVDGNLQTPWAGASTVDTPVTVTVKLTEPTKLTHVDIAWFKGSARKAYFTLETSVDGETWEIVQTDNADNKFISSGVTELPESYLVPTEEAVQYIRFAGYGNVTNEGKTSLWNSFYELEVYGKVEAVEPPVKPDEDKDEDTDNDNNNGNDNNNDNDNDNDNDSDKDDDKTNDKESATGQAKPHKVTAEEVKDAIKEAVESQEQTVTLEVEKEGHIVLPEGFFDTLAKEETLQSVTIQNDQLTVTLPKQFTQLKEDASVEIILSTSQVDKAPCYEVVVKADGKVVTHFDKLVTLALTHEVAATENVRNLTTFMLLEDGTRVNIGGVYKDGAMHVGILEGGKFVVAVNNVTFEDVATTHKYYESIQALAAKGYVTGVTETTFAPNKAMTRAEFTALLANVIKLEPSAETSAFKDVAPDAWYTETLNACVQAGLIYGVSADAFAPEQTISTQDMLIIMSRALDYLGVQPEEDQDKVYNAEDVSDYAKAAVKRSVQVGLIDNVDVFNATGDVERGYMAAILETFIYKMY